MTIAPCRPLAAQVACEELDFLLRVELPRAPARATVVAAAGEGGAEGAVPSNIASAPSTSTVGVTDTGALTINLKIPALADLERAGLSSNDRVGGASVDTLHAAAEVRAWQRALPDILTKVSRLHVEVRSRLEQAARATRSEAEEDMHRAAARADQLHATLDPTFPALVPHNTSLRTLLPGVKATLDGLTEVCVTLASVRHRLLEVTRDEVTLRMPASATIKAIAAYCNRLAGNVSALPLPWGVPVDVFNTPNPVLGVEVALSAIQPFIAVMTTTRNMLTRMDRWLHTPVFAHDRDDVTDKLAEMATLAEETAPLVERPVPPLAAFLAAATRDGAAPAPGSLGALPPTARSATAVTSDAKSRPPSRGSAPSAVAAAVAAASATVVADDTAAGSTGAAPQDAAAAAGTPSAAGARMHVPGVPDDVDAREYFAATFGLVKEDFAVDHVAASYARALLTRLTHFRNRYLPLIRVLCNPNLTVSHWDRINSVVGSRIGPPSNKQRGFFGGGGGGGPPTSSAAAPIGTAPRQHRASMMGVGGTRPDDATAATGEGGAGVAAPGTSRRASIGSVTFAVPVGAAPNDAGGSVTGLHTARSSVTVPGAAGGGVGSGADLSFGADDDGGLGAGASASVGDGLGGDATALGGVAGVTGTQSQQPLFNLAGSGASTTSAAIVALLTPAGGLPTTTGAAVRGPSLLQLIELFNLDDKLTELQTISDAADRAAGVGV